MDSALGQLFGIVLPVVAIISVFTFVAVASWSENRRKEREAYYRHETYRKIVEQPGESGQAVLDLMRREEMRKARKRIEGLKLGGLVTTAVGVGVMIFLYYLAPEEGVFLAGLIPLLIGLVLTVYGLFLAPRPTETP